MAKFGLVSVCLLLLLLLILLAGTARAEESYPWPKPRKTEWENAGPIPVLQQCFKIVVPNHKFLQEAALRYEHLVQTENWRPIKPSAHASAFNIVESWSCSIEEESTFTKSSCNTLRKLEVFVHDLQAELQHGVDESYLLTVACNSGGAANLSAATPWGAMRGLETFSQLVVAGSGSAIIIEKGVRIQDSPLFVHRGLVLDTSRNFYPVEDIQRTIKAMSHNKMNVFHWHITDSQSFPLQLTSEPELAEKGSYSPEMRYSAQDISKIIAFGHSHGVRIVPEIDAPGHTASWAEAYPDIVTCAGMFWSDPAGAESLAAEPGAGQLNPLNSQTYAVYNNVVKEVAEMFPDLMFHAGADEINPGCWKKDAKIASYLANGGNLSSLLELFITKTNPVLTKTCHKTTIYWEDIILSSSVSVRPELLPTETTILHTWNNGPNNTKLITSKGYRAIVSSADYYYLDCGHGGWLGNDSRYTKTPLGGGGGSWCAPFKTWQTIYDYDITQGLTDAEAKLVLGGAVALWSEQSDGAGMDSRIWPRASAMAEALWSGNAYENGTKRYAEALDRLHQWRYRMVARGIAAEAIQPLWCLLNPGMCNRNA